MAVNLLKKNSLVLVASLLLAGHVQATELLNSSMTSRASCLSF